MEKIITNKIYATFSKRNIKLNAKKKHNLRLNIRRDNNLNRWEMKRN